MRVMVTLVDHSNVIFTENGIFLELFRLAPPDVTQTLLPFMQKFIMKMFTIL